MISSYDVILCHLMMSYCDVIIQYWRLMIADNYGDPTSCLAEVQFFGVGECKYHTVLHCITLVLSHITFSLVPQAPGYEAISHWTQLHTVWVRYSVLHQLIRLHCPLHREWRHWLVWETWVEAIPEEFYTESKASLIVTPWFDTDCDTLIWHWCVIFTLGTGVQSAQWSCPSDRYRLTGHSMCTHLSLSLSLTNMHNPFPRQYVYSLLHTCISH